MQRHRFFIWLRTAIVALVMLALVPAHSFAAAQTTSNSFESTLGYTVTWDDNWSFDETLMFEAEGVFDIITLWNEDSGFLMITGMVGPIDDAAELLDPDEDEEVTSSDLESEVPQIITEDDTFRTLEEAYVVDDGGVGITVAVTTTPANFDTVMANAQAGVQVNGSPVLMGEPLGDSENAPASSASTDPDDATEESGNGITRTTRGGTDETAEATEESGNGVTRTTRGSTAGTEEATDEATEAATVESGNGITRTTRNADETPESTGEADLPTEEATDEATEESRDRVTTGLEVYEGPVYGYSFEYDAEVWDVQSEYEEEGVDGLSMTSPTGTVTIWAWDGYGNDPVGCLDGEAEYYATEDDSISDWTPVEDENGDPLRKETDEIAWGVFSLTYQNDRGDDTELVDYISCQSIPGQDAVLIVLLSSAPENYNDNLDDTFDILDTLTFGDTPVETEVATEEATTEPTDEADPTEASGDGDVRTEIDTNFDGSQYTSPIYGFTVYVPLEWTIATEEVNGDTETLVLENGTSVVTLLAAPAPRGDLAACVDFAAENSGYNLELLQNSNGGEFRGEYGDEAFANFVYQDGSTEMMYFISCRTIPGGDGVLILTQDVAFDQFTSERKFRNEIEESITMP